MSSERIQEILHQLRNLNDELREHLREQQEKTFYQLKGRRIEFEASIKAQHKRLKISLVKYLVQSQWQHLLSAPFIYGMILPMLFLDLGLSVYQWTCFRLYHIKPVRRSDYIVLDHRHLHYLNLIQKINCLYCSYGNGLFAYAREIGSLTEQYWCPIKHAKKIADTPTRYSGYLEYGDGEDYPVKSRKLREAIIASDKDVGG